MPCWRRWRGWRTSLPACLAGCLHGRALEPCLLSRACSIQQQRPGDPPTSQPALHRITVPSPPQLADLVEALLADRARLAAAGRLAQAKARSWTEHDNAQALVQHVQEALAGGEAAPAPAAEAAGGEQAAVEVAA